MKKLVVAAVLAASSLALAAPAAAQPMLSDEYEFVNDVNAIGITHDKGVQGIVAVGWLICRSLDYGNSPESIARDLFLRSYDGYSGISITQARQEVILSTVHLCPEHNYT